MGNNKMDILGEEYLSSLMRLNQNTEEIARQAVYEAAGLVADEIRKNLNQNLADPKSAATQNRSGKSKRQTSTGTLASSLGIAPIELKKGFFGTKIGFAGYDEKGIPNPLKARVMESGSSKIRKRPFVRPAVKATQQNARDVMDLVLCEHFQETFTHKK